MYYTLTNYRNSLIDSFFGDRESVTKDEIIEHDEQFNIMIELAGIKKSDIDIKFDGDYLVVEATKKAPEDESKVISSSRLYGTISKKYKVGSIIDRTNVKADYEDGVLTITLSKTGELKSRKIEIS